MSAVIAWLAVGLTAGLIIWSFRREAGGRLSRNEARASDRTEAKRLHAGRVTVMAEQAGERRAYIESLRPEWPYSTYCKLDGRHADLLISGDASKLLFLLGLAGSPSSGSFIYEVNTSSIVEVRLERRSMFRHQSRVEDVIVPQPNRKSTVGRTLVGGVLLGPVGAAVGAASSMKGPPPKVEKRTIIEKIEEEAAPLIVVSTRDLARPVFKLDLIGKAKTDEWYARLLAATR